MTGRPLANAASNQAEKTIIHIINRTCNQRSGVSSFASLDMPLLFWGTLVNKKGQHFLINREWVGSIEKAWRLDSDPSCLCFAQYFSSGSLTNFFTTIKVAKLLWRQVMSQLKNLTGLVTNSILSSGFSIKVCASCYDNVLGSRTLLSATNLMVYFLPLCSLRKLRLTREWLRAP